MTSRSRRSVVCSIAWLLLLPTSGCEDAPPPRRPAARRDAGAQAKLSDAALPEPLRTQHPDAAPPEATPGPKSTQLTRGEYLVRHVAACPECHTPRLPSGNLDESRFLSGVENLIDVEPGDDARGMVHSRNLTADDKTGLGGWSDEQIKRAFQQGVDDQGKTLHWMMPYWLFNRMSADDADAIVAFLRTVPAREHALPENQPTAVGENSKPYELPSAAIPESTLDASDPQRASAERGRYLATSVAPCMLCHTTTIAGDATVPIDSARMFAGKRSMVPVRLGVALPPNPPHIDSVNLTPHANGIGGWSADDVANTLLVGVSRDSLPVCDPMPSYMGGSFVGMTQADALDLGHYFTSLPPRDSGPIAKCCNACHGNKGMDAGM